MKQRNTISTKWQSDRARRTNWKGKWAGKGREEDRREEGRRGLHLPPPPLANEKEWSNERMTGWQQGAWESRRDDQIRTNGNGKVIGSNGWGH